MITTDISPDRFSPPVPVFFSRNGETRRTADAKGEGRRRTLRLVAGTQSRVTVRRTVNSVRRSGNTDRRMGFGRVSRFRTADRTARRGFLSRARTSAGGTSIVCYAACGAGEEAGEDGGEGGGGRSADVRLRQHRHCQRCVRVTLSDRRLFSFPPSTPPPRRPESVLRVPRKPRRARERREGRTRGKVPPSRRRRRRSREVNHQRVTGRDRRVTPGGVRKAVGAAAVAARDGAGEQEARGTARQITLVSIRTFRAFRSMSSSEQLTLGAKLCAILIRHSRSPPLCLRLSLPFFARSLELADYFENTVRTISPISTRRSLPPIAALSFLSLSLSLPLPSFFPDAIFSSRAAASRMKIQGRRKEGAKTRSHQHYRDTRSVEEHRRARRIARGGGPSRADYANGLSNRGGDDLQGGDARGAATTVRHMARAGNTLRTVRTGGACRTEESEDTPEEAV